MKLALVRDLFFVWYTAQDASESVLLTFPSVVGPGSVVLECDFTGSIRGGGRRKLAVPYLRKNPKNVLPEQTGISMNLYEFVCECMQYVYLKFMISCYMNLCDHPKNFARRTIILDSNYNPYIYTYLMYSIYIYLYNNLMMFFFSPKWWCLLFTKSPWQMARSFERIVPLRLQWNCGRFDSLWTGLCALRRPLQWWEFMGRTDFWDLF